MQRGHGVLSFHRRLAVVGEDAGARHRLQVYGLHGGRHGDRRFVAFRVRRVLAECDFLVPGEFSRGMHRNDWSHRGALASDDAGNHFAV